MKLHLNNRPDLVLVHSCVVDRDESNTASDAHESHAGEGHARYRIRIAENWYKQSLILTSRSVDLWDIDNVSDLSTAHFQRLADLKAEVVILGTGKCIVFPHSAIIQPLMQKHIGLEVMDTGAACRTYNILADDGRRVVACLLI